MGDFVTNLVLITLLLSLLFNYGRKPTVLCCGIFGFSGKDGKKADPRKLLILGLYNRTRGVDSCGYYYNGNIVKGVGDQADFKDFIIHNKFVPGDLPFETVMAHTRKSTYGTHTLENAHPHNIENYVQTHNGTIKNIWTLCNNHNVDHSKITVDSIGIATIIQKDGFKVLEEYEGHAALTMVFMDDPASLYLYHGASRDKIEDKTTWEERPLFTLKTPEGLYYSSMEESLVIINTSKTVKPEILPHNEVYLVQNGTIVTNIYTVHRSEMNIPKVYVYNKENNYGSKADQKKLPFEISEEKVPKDEILFKESEPLEYVDSDIYYRYGRHFGTVNTEKNGVYSTYEALLNGVYTIDRTGKILEDGEVSNAKYEKFYFIRGVMMRDRISYEKCLKQHKLIEFDVVANTSYLISAYSRYPVTTFPGEGTGVAESLKNIWFHNNKRFTGVVTPKFTKRSYYIERGRLNAIYPAFKNEIVSVEKKIDLENIILDQKNYEEAGEPEMSSTDFYDYLKDTIDEWCDKIIKEEDVESIPEVVLLYMECFIKQYQPRELTEEQQLQELTTLLSGLIKNKQTFIEYTKLLFNEGWVRDIENIKKCFGSYSASDLIELENRYKFVDFTLDLGEEVQDAEIIDTKINDTDSCCLPDAKELAMEQAEEFNSIVEKENEKLYVRQIKTKVDEFVALADNLQLLSSESAQTEAYKIYKAAGQFMEKLQEFNTKN